MKKQQKPKSPSRTVDIFKILGKIDTHDVNYYTDLEEHEQKQLHPLVLMRWLSGVKDPNVIQLLNYTVNPHIFSLVNHKELLMRSLLIVSGGGRRRYQWMPRAKEVSKSKKVEVVQQYYDCSLKEAQMYLTHHSTEDIIQMASELGYQKDDVKLLTK